MSVHDHEHRSHGKAGTSMIIMGLACLVIVGVVLLIPYPQNGLGALIYVPLLLLCPLMHFFMHGSHGRHDDRGS